jgi:hypothetical protein
MANDVLIYQFRMEDYATGYLPAMAREQARAREALKPYGEEHTDWAFVGGHYGNLLVFFTCKNKAEEFRNQWEVVV